MTTDLRTSSRTASIDASNGTHGNNESTSQQSASTDTTDSRSVANTSKSTMTYRGVTAGKSQKVLITRPASTRGLQWFNNLSVRRKQLTGLFTSEIISILGLVGVGSFLIVSSGRSQLLNQTQSELSVAGIRYDIKIDQMGFGFRGQSDNQAIINVATADALGNAIEPESLANVRQILQNEVKARNIEYATLVGSDRQIIASANANRQGETFDPEGLVGTVLQNPRQIKTSAIVDWEELQREQPPLPDDFAEQASLIRYTITPVKASDSEQVVGVLVSGDVVNGKEAIPQGTLAAFENGYSGIYQYQQGEGFRLATSLDTGDSDDIETAAVDVPLTDVALLEQAVANPERAATRRGEVGDQTYTMAAKAINNFNGEPVAILVRGTSERPLNLLIGDSLKLQMLIALAALLIDFLLARLLGRSILRPLLNLQQAAQKFKQGDRQARAGVFARDEVGWVAQSFNQLADNVAQSEIVLQTQAVREKESAERASLVAELTTRIRQSLDEETILSASVDGLRGVLDVDRVVIYRFNADYTAGDITAESVGRGWKRAKGSIIEDPLTPEAIQRYYEGRVTFIEDRDQADISHCHCEVLENLEVKANLVAPLISGENLVGLICVHQCREPRRWQAEEIDLMQQISVQIGYALSQARLLERQQLTAKREQQLNEIISQMRQSLDEASIYRSAVHATRQVLQTDRVVVYRFDANWKGTFVAESVEAEWPKAMGNDLYDPCFADKYIEQYRQGRVQVTPNLATANLTKCHLEQLAPYKVKANLVAPIVVEERLIGLFIAHQCSEPRDWDSIDVNFFKQTAIQLGYALEQSRLFTESQALSEERLQRQQSLQMQLVQLLSDVEGASQGDLTVRADVTAGEIGTVADFFNAIIESLRQIVTQVKQSSEQVNVSISQNESAIQNLADDALKQAEEVTHTLVSLEQMTQSIHHVSASARQAAVVANNASQTAESSGEAMELTVQNILNLREIIGETSKKVKRLGESSQQISKVVSLINQIAMQTNLLAINAGIEAARAGEDGQGFAVVAEEVGELASRSADATKDIERIVETIQQETVEVVEAMDRSTSEVVAGTHLVEDAKQNLGRILEVSQQIDQLVQSVSEATLSQATVSETVMNLMQDIAEVSERTSESSRRISDSLQQTVEVAQELQASVGTFRTHA